MIPGIVASPNAERDASYPAIARLGRRPDRCPTRVPDVRVLPHRDVGMDAWDLDRVLWVHRDEPGVRSVVGWFVFGNAVAGS